MSLVLVFYFISRKWDNLKIVRLKSLLFPFTAYSITSFPFLSKVYWFAGSYFSSLFGTWCRKYFSDVINCSSNPWCFKELFSILWTDLFACVFRKKGDTNFVKEDGLRKLILAPEDYIVHTILHSIQVEPLICSVFCHIRKDLYPFIRRQPWRHLNVI